MHSTEYPDDSIEYPDDSIQYPDDSTEYPDDSCCNKKQATKTKPNEITVVCTMLPRDNGFLLIKARSRRLPS